MKLGKFTAGAVIILSLLSLTGCGSKKIQSLAYNHEPDKEVLAFYDNGKAVFKGEEYKYSADDTSIIITDKDNSTVVHCAKDGDKIILYEKTTYKRQVGKTEDGIVGLWTQGNGWSYEFTAEGKFSEDTFFYGSYSVDEENHCIKLMYDDPIEDAYLYYSLEGDELIVDYPWPMVQTTENADSSSSK